MAYPMAVADSAVAQPYKARFDAMRTAMEMDRPTLIDRCIEYLNWYSPQWNGDLRRHDAWDEGIRYEDYDTTRINIPISRAVVDIWSALEAGTPPSSRAEPDQVTLPPPTVDAAMEDMFRQDYSVRKMISSRKADMRSAIIRRYRRLDDFRKKNYRATKRKNLYGFTWVKVIPDLYQQRPCSYVVKNPTTVFPLWSNRDPDDIESILCAYQESAILANQRYGLGLDFKDGKVSVGQYSPYYQDLDRWFDPSMTMVWVEELWWIERTFSKGRQVSSKVCMATQVCDQIVGMQEYPDWHYVPFVPFQNMDERDTMGWSDIAGVMDINDEINKRMSQQGDVIGMYSAPRFQLTGSTLNGERDLPEPFGMISLSDTERIEQILTRIDVFPTNYHIDQMFDLLSRVTGLPPIVWGLIANAQTSGRALTASWKATETRLAPKLMEDESSLRRWDAIVVDYIRHYDWDGASSLFTMDRGQAFMDWTYDFPPMEPRDFQEVTMNAITKRDAGLTSTVQAMRETGDEKAEDTIEEVRAEWMDPILHPDKVQARTLLTQMDIQNQMAQQQLDQASAPPPAAAAPPTSPGGPPGGPPAPPPGGGGLQASPGILFRNGDVSNQQLVTGQPVPLGPPPTAGPPQ